WLGARATETWSTPTPARPPSVRPSRLTRRSDEHGHAPGTRRGAWGSQQRDRWQPRAEHAGDAATRLPAVAGAGQRVVADGAPGAVRHARQGADPLRGAAGH